MFLRLTRAGDVQAHLTPYIMIRVCAFNHMVRVLPADGNPAYTFIGRGVLNTNGHELGDSVVETPEQIAALEEFALRQSSAIEGTTYPCDDEVSLVVLSNGVFGFAPYPESK